MRYCTPATVSGDTNGAQRGELRVESDNVFEPDRGLYMTAKDRTGLVNLWLREADARKLAEKLGERYGLVPLAAPKVGDEVTLLRGARYSGGSISVGTSTRFKVVYEVDGDGDLSVRALDGAHEGRDFYVLAQYLRSASAILPKPEAPAEPAKPAFELSQAVTLTQMHAGMPAGTTGLVRGKTAAGSGWRIVVVERDLAVNKVVPESKLAPLVKVEAEPVAAPYEPKVGDVVELKPEFRMSNGALSPTCGSRGARRRRRSPLSPTPTATSGSMPWTVRARVRAATSPASTSSVWPKRPRQPARGPAVTRRS